ncbi:MAG: nucleoside recognition domain-containing protein [Anaerolineae bacterium]
MSTALTQTIRYEPSIERAIQEIEAHLRGQYRLSRRAVALLLLQGDEEFDRLVRQQEAPADVAAIQNAVAAAQTECRCSLSYLINVRRQAAARQIVDGVIEWPTEQRRDRGERLSQAMMNPWTGVPILLVVLFALYEFVGVFGAQTLVGFLEGTVFEGTINPWVDRVIAGLIPWPTLQALFGGSYGIITLGIRYAVALILPIVGAFFIAFSIIEDSGYLPRLAMLIDGVFKRIGLNGRAVIPMVLGFGCDTMATIVTRTLETGRERVIATMLLALAIPCSAQLGVILAILVGQPAALGIWVGAVTGIFLLVGFLAARLMPGERPSFYMEIPPLRWPKLSNVILKTYTRIEWYFREVIPFFVLASVLIWIGQVTGVFDLVVRALQPLVHLLGLPDETATVFLFGFFRRDYGAAGLYDIQASLSGVQLAVAAVTLTLFVPCIAQFAVMWKERGPKTTLGMVAFIFPFAFLVGALLNFALTTLGVVL